MADEDPAAGRALNPSLRDQGSGITVRHGKSPRVHGLDQFGLSVPALTRLGPRQVRLSIQLVGKTVPQLTHLPPKERDIKLRVALANQLKRMRRDFPEVEFVSRGKTKPSWTIDAVMRARDVTKLGAKPYVKDVTIGTIEDRKVKKVRPELRWFCVWGIVAIQIEGRTKGLVDLEDRLVVVKAFDFEDAERRLKSEWRRYAEPYMNPYGALVRWQLVSVQDVFSLSDDTFDPRGTEVFSRLRTAQMRPEYRWLPQATRRPAVDRQGKRKRG